MGALEIILLIAGIAIIILSFVLPTEKKTVDYETKKLIRKEVEAAVSVELEGMKQRMEEVTDESIQNAMEKTERTLERISNEKIMAVNDYSETVFSEIDKNHKEVMFLYDMLNDKHRDLKDAVTEVEQQVRRVKSIQKEEQEKEENANTADVSTEQATNQSAEQPATKKTKKPAEFTPLKVVDAGNEHILKAPNVPDMSDKDRILAMHNEGMSDIEIAIAMGRGIGEVKLVIELFEGAKE